MGRKRLLVVLKPIEADPVSQSEGPSRITNPQSKMLHHLDSRRKVHNDAISCCQNILRRKPIEWNSVVLTDLSQPVHDVNLVVTVGGDGTLLQASHFIDDSVPVLGVNSDPTQPKEVEKLSNEIDASRSTGYLCATTIDNFEEVLDNILQGRTIPSKLTRISVYVNSQVLPTYALNDVLIAHPCPAALSQFSFKIKRDGELCSPLVNSRSSGLRFSTAAGSTAAMLSAGGFPMPILSQDLQFMVREPISPGNTSSLMHGLIKSHQSMEVTWFCKEGGVYIDGSHVFFSIQNGDAIEISSKAPILKVFLSHNLQTTVKKCEEKYLHKNVIACKY
ncbi:NADH kinase-like [Pyrus communis]|uniref:NADH kinase-like n=1 Tax=Pyrus communis TaxID=23211 RepID=UPI0035BFED44